MELSYSLEEIDKISTIVLEKINGRKIVSFYGNLGAGKTTLISSLCKKMGVVENTSSPTFSIINEYNTKGGQIIYHMDLYRLKDEEEAIQAGVEECLTSNNLCLVEWPEKAENLFDGTEVKVYLKTISAVERSMNLLIPKKNA